LTQHEAIDHRHDPNSSTFKYAIARLSVVKIVIAGNSTRREAR